MKDLRFRQIHLDFHTSPYISGVGEKFDKKVWQERLLEANVDSITCFSLCHHGMSYHPTKVGKMHPSLKFDLLRAQMDACKEIGVKVQIYLSAGLNEYAAVTHPEWREVTVDGQLYGGIFSALLYVGASDWQQCSVAGLHIVYVPAWRVPVLYVGASASGLSTGGGVKKAETLARISAIVL